MVSGIRDTVPQASTIEDLTLSGRSGKAVLKDVTRNYPAKVRM